MINTVFSVVMLTAIVSNTFCQRTIDVPSVQKAFFAFIPDSYVPLDTAMGYLNSDPYQDVIFILKTLAEDTLPESPDLKRPVLLLLGNPDKTFTLAGRNDNLVDCVTCGGAAGDPYAGVEIKNGEFTIHHFGGSTQRWSTSHTFRYSQEDNAWYLSKISENEWDSRFPQKGKSTVKTRADFGVVRF